MVGATSFPRTGEHSFPPAGRRRSRHRRFRLCQDTNDHRSRRRPTWVRSRAVVRCEEDPCAGGGRLARIEVHDCSSRARVAKCCGHDPRGDGGAKLGLAEAERPTPPRKNGEGRSRRPKFPSSPLAGRGLGGGAASGRPQTRNVTSCVIRVASRRAPPLTRKDGEGNPAI
jgi:hypothetical protein